MGYLLVHSSFHGQMHAPFHAASPINFVITLLGSQEEWQLLPVVHSRVSSLHGELPLVLRPEVQLAQREERMLAVVRKALNHISREGVRELGIHGVHERAADLLVPDFPRELDLRQDEGSDEKKKKKKKKRGAAIIACCSLWQATTSQFKEGSANVLQ